MSVPQTLPASRYPIDALLADIGDMSTSLDPADLRRKSRDYYWYSPILAARLKDKFADIIVTPRDEADVVRVAAACYRHRIPLTVRGGCACRKSNPNIFVVQSAEDWAAKNTPCPLHGAR
jgi:hypothetical protein